MIASYPPLYLAIEHNLMGIMGNRNLSNHPPSGVESTCEGSVIPGLCAARGEEQHTHTVRISVINDQSTEIKISALGTALPTNITAQRNNHSHHTYIHTMTSQVLPGDNFNAID